MGTSDVPDDLRGSSPMMTTKDILWDVWHDMKFVRPALEGLLAAKIVSRIEALEDVNLKRDTRVTLVSQVLVIGRSWILFILGALTTVVAILASAHR